MPSEARQKKIMEKLNRAQKCSILGPQNLGSRRGPGPRPLPGSAPVPLCTTVSHSGLSFDLKRTKISSLRFQYKSQDNKPEQISSDHDQMSLAGRGERVGPQVWCPWGGGTVPCDLSHDAYDVTYPDSGWQTNACENNKYRYNLRWNDQVFILIKFIYTETVRKCIKCDLVTTSRRSILLPQSSPNCLSGPLGLLCHTALRYRH